MTILNFLLKFILNQVLLKFKKKKKKAECLPINEWMQHESSKSK